MNSRERVICSLNHVEPDQIPFDLGGTGLTSISKFNYNKLRVAFGLPEVDPVIMDIFQQNVLVDDDMFELMECDVRPVVPGNVGGFSFNESDEGDGYIRIQDEWGIGWKMPNEYGLYYDMFKHPLEGKCSIETLKAYPWPDPTDPYRFKDIKVKTSYFAKDKQKAVTLDGFCSGIVEMAAWLRGYSDFYVDVVQNDSVLNYLLDLIVEMKQEYWEIALREAGDNVDVVMEADDLAGQSSLLISPSSYRKIIKPRHKKLFQFIKDRTRGKLFFHSCGAIRPLIPDLIEIGVDILNPVQVNAAGMDSGDLKRTFGNDLTFWGGGVDTQGAFSNPKPLIDAVDNDVNHRIIDFKPNGGFVFAAIHNIQANVPPENIITMWKKFKQLRSY
jgi:uroporphyrinogen decarboxylase